MVLASAWLANAMAETPVRVIFDTDLGADVDDAGAIAVLHALADQGEADVLAMGLSVTHRWSAPCLDAMNTYYGRPGIPIGVVKGKGVDDGCKYAESIAKEFPHDLNSPDEAPDVVSLYRQVLAKQPDNSVVLITVGFLTNVANLLDSKPDEYSKLTGTELVRQKVRSWVCMGGHFPTGNEYNIKLDAASSQKAIQNWPVAIVFSGFEIGDPIQTGAGLKAAPANNPIRRAYDLYNGLSMRSSWDQTAVLYAVRGETGKVADVWDVHSNGSNEIFADGRNLWHDTPNRSHAYLVKKMPSAQVAQVIEGLMLQAPKNANK